MRALILAAGHGTRLGELTRTTPKPLLHAGGRPLIGWIVANLRRCGIRRIAVNLHHGSSELAEWLGDGGRHGLDEVVLSHEHELLGTAGALRPLAAWLSGGPFLVHYGDIVTDQDLGALEVARAASGALAAILVHRRQQSNSIVDVAPDGMVRRFRERPTPAELAEAGPSWVHSGIAACAPGILECLPPAGPADLPRDVYAGLAAAGRLRALPLAGYRMAVDSPGRLASLDKDIRLGALALASGTEFA